MKAINPVVAGIVAAVIVGSFVFGEAIGRSSHPSASSTTYIAVAPAVSAELPQDQVRDMTYN